MVPSHREIAWSVNEGVPITLARPRSAAARAFRALADAYAAPLAAPAAGKRSRRARKLSRSR
jgi:MinD-like ATPase involved in chromosome partitioning or flagellar assembly